MVIQKTGFHCQKFNCDIFFEFQMILDDESEEGHNPLDRSPHWVIIALMLDEEDRWIELLTSRSNHMYLYTAWVDHLQDLLDLTGADLTWLVEREIYEESIVHMAMSDMSVDIDKYDSMGYSQADIQVLEPLFEYNLEEIESNGVIYEDI